MGKYENETLTFQVIGVKEVISLNFLVRIQNDKLTLSPYGVTWLDIHCHSSFHLFLPVFLLVESRNLSRPVPTVRQRKKWFLGVLGSEKEKRFGVE